MFEEITEISILDSLNPNAVKEYKQIFQFHGPAKLRNHLLGVCDFDKVMAKLIIQEIRDGYRNE
jgi:hypothetical protein